MRFYIPVILCAVSTLAMSVPKPNAVARAVYPRQSAGVCTFGTCPANDNQGNNPQGAGTISGSTLTCTYLTETCFYDTTTGVEENGSGFSCRGMAVPGGCPSARRRAQFKREDNFTVVLRREEARKEAEHASHSLPRA